MAYYSRRYEKHIHTLLQSKIIIINVCTQHYTIAVAQPKTTKTQLTVQFAERAREVVLWQLVVYYNQIDIQFKIRVQKLTSTSVFQNNTRSISLSCCVSSELLSTPALLLFCKLLSLRLIMMLLLLRLLTKLRCVCVCLFVRLLYAEKCKV